MNSVPQTSPSGKTCNACGEWKTISEFYVRSGYQNKAVMPGHYLTECKACMKVRGRKPRLLHDTQPRVFSEKLAIEYLEQHGTPSLPGKAVSAADVDVVAFGCVWIEVKYAKEGTKGQLDGVFTFTSSAKQRERGYLAHIVLLICERRDGRRSFHFFDAQDDVFYIFRDGTRRVKNGFQVRFEMSVIQRWSDRVVMTPDRMEAARDNTGMIFEKVAEVSLALQNGGQRQISERVASKRENRPEKKWKIEPLSEQDHRDFEDFIVSMHEQKWSA